MVVIATGPPQKILPKKDPPLQMGPAGRAYSGAIRNKILSTLCRKLKPMLTQEDE